MYNTVDFPILRFIVTHAQGMDIPDIELVVYGTPTTISQLYQVHT